MAIFSKQIFDNPYVDLGNDRDVCALCKKEYIAAHPNEYDYQIDKAMFGQLRDKKVFKIFKNSNTPLVLCAKHLQIIADELQEDL